MAANLSDDEWQALEIAALSLAKDCVEKGLVPNFIERGQTGVTQFRNCKGFLEELKLFYEVANNTEITPFDKSVKTEEALRKSKDNIEVEKKTFIRKTENLFQIFKAEYEKLQKEEEKLKTSLGKKKGGGSHAKELEKATRIRLLKRKREERKAAAIAATKLEDDVEPKNKTITAEEEKRINDENDEKLLESIKKLAVDNPAAFKDVETEEKFRNALFVGSKSTDHYKKRNSADKVLEIVRAVKGNKSNMNKELTEFIFGRTVNSLSELERETNLKLVVETIREGLSQEKQLRENSIRKNLAEQQINEKEFVKTIKELAKENPAFFKSLEDNNIFKEPSVGRVNIYQKKENAEKFLKVLDKIEASKLGDFGKKANDFLDITSPAERGRRLRLVVEAVQTELASVWEEEKRLKAQKEMFEKEQKEKAKQEREKQINQGKLKREEAEKERLEREEQKKGEFRKLSNTIRANKDSNVSPRMPAQLLEQIRKRHESVSNLGASGIDKNNDAGNKMFFKFDANSKNKNQYEFGNFKKDDIESHVLLTSVTGEIETDQGDESLKISDSLILIQKAIEKSRDAYNKQYNPIESNSGVRVENWEVKLNKKDRKVEVFESNSDSNTPRFTAEPVEDSNQMKMDFNEGNVNFSDAMIAIGAYGNPIELNSDNKHDVLCFVMAAKQLGKLNCLVLTEDTKQLLTGEFEKRLAQNGLDSQEIQILKNREIGDSQSRPYYHV